MKLINMTLLILALSLLSSCSSGKFAVRDAHEYDQGKSEAMNIAEAAGISKGMRDVSKDKLDEFRGPYRDSSIPGAVLAGGTITKALRPIPHTSYGLSSTMFLVNFFNVELVPGRDNRIFGWAPESEVTKRNVKHYPSAATALNFLDALETALPVDYSIVSKKVPYRAIIGPQGSELLTFSMTSGKDQKIVRMQQQQDTRPGYLLEGGAKLELNVNDPDKIGGETGLFKILLDASRQAPDWLYIYLAPGKGASNLPVILHKGKVLYFEKPEATHS